MTCEPGVGGATAISFVVVGDLVDNHHPTPDSPTTPNLRGLELLHTLVEDLHLVDVGNGGGRLRGREGAGNGNRAGTVAGATSTTSKLSLTKSRVGFR